MNILFELKSFFPPASDLLFISSNLSLKGSKEESLNQEHFKSLLILFWGPWHFQVGFFWNLFVFYFINTDTSLHLNTFLGLQDFYFY